MPCKISVEESTHLTEVVLEHGGLRIEAANLALISIESNKLPSCTFWYSEGSSSELVELIDKKFGEESDEAIEACDADLVITYSDGNVEYVQPSRTEATIAAHVGYMIGRYAMAHKVPHEKVLELLSLMHRRHEADEAEERQDAANERAGRLERPQQRKDRPRLSMRLE